MMDVLHRILTGQCLTPRQITWAGVFILYWFGTDQIQFWDWVISKF